MHWWTGARGRAARAGTVTTILQGMPHADGQRDGSRTATAMTVGAMAAAATLMPGGWARSVPRQLVATGIGTALGAGFGATFAQPASRLAGGGDAVEGGLIVGGI